MDSSTNAFTVTLLPMNAVFVADASQPLIDSALAAHIDLPTSCRNGTCRACLCQLASGQVTYRIDWPGVSVDERREGWILPCVAHPASDLVLDQPGAVRLSWD